MPAAVSPIGASLVRVRRARGLTQEDLADRSGISVDVIARLEQGRKQGARWTTLTQLSRALGVDLARLVSGPVSSGADDEKAIVDVHELRRAIADHADILGSALVELPEQSELQRAFDLTWHTYHSGGLAEVVAALPPMIGSARRLVQRGEESAADALSGCYLMAAGACAVLGHLDLAFLAVERAAAQQADNALAGAAIAAFLSSVLIRQGRYDDAEQCAIAGASRIEPTFGGAQPRQLAAFGNLMINASRGAARAGAHARADDHLAVARAAAARYPVDGVDRWCVFGPRAVGMCQVFNAVERHDLETALRLALEVPAPDGGALPATWEARFMLSVAFAHAETGGDSAAVACLAQARCIAPEWTKYHPLATTVVLKQLGRPSRASDELARLAAYLNIL